jgi:hypothetical protein
MPSLGNLLQGDPGSWELNAIWEVEATEKGLPLQTLNGITTVMSRTVTTTLTSEPINTLTADFGGGESKTLEPEGRLFIEHEWPWRLEGLPFELGYGGTITFVTYDADGLPISRSAFVHVQGGEPTWTERDTVITWRVTVTYEGPEERTLTAWYRAEPPHTLIRYDDGKVSYVHKSTTEISRSEFDDLLH